MSSANQAILQGRIRALESLKIGGELSKREKRELKDAKRELRDMRKPDPISHYVADVRSDLGFTGAARDKAFERYIRYGMMSEEMASTFRITEGRSGNAADFFVGAGGSLTQLGLETRDGLGWSTAPNDMGAAAPGPSGYYGGYLIPQGSNLGPLGQ